MKEITRVRWAEVETKPWNMDKLRLTMECDDGSIYVAEVEDDESVPINRLEVVGRIENGERAAHPSRIPARVERQITIMTWLDPEPHAVESGDPGFDTET